MHRDDSPGSVVFVGSKIQVKCTETIVLGMSYSTLYGQTKPLNERFSCETSSVRLRPEIMQRHSLRKSFLPAYQNELANIVCGRI